MVIPKFEEEEEENDNEIEEDDSGYPIQFMPEVMLSRFFKNMKVVSDILHLIKRLRYHLFDVCIYCGFDK